jgi:hypothetical protein
LAEKLLVIRLWARMLRCPPNIVGNVEAAMMMRAGTAVVERVKIAAAVSPTESEIATVAYRFWLDNGCPVGSDREDWFRAEEMLKNALVANCEDLLRNTSIPRFNNRPESEMPAGLRWGHWEAWEREWGGARWIWDLGPTPSVF